MTSSSSLTDAVLLYVYVQLIRSLFVPVYSDTRTENLPLPHLPLIADSQTAIAVPTPETLS